MTVIITIIRLFYFHVIRVVGWGRNKSKEQIIEYLISYENAKRIKIE